MKKILLLAPLLFLFLLSIANAQLITIGVQPSVVVLNFFKSGSYRVEFGFSNDGGEVNAVYTLEPDDCLKNIIKNYPKSVLVPKGTNRTSNPIRVWITFEPDYKGNKTCFLYVYAKPEGARDEGVLRIKPSVGIKIEVRQPEKVSYLPPSTIYLPLSIQGNQSTRNEQKVQQASQPKGEAPYGGEAPQEHQEVLVHQQGIGFPMWIVWLVVGGVVCVIAWKVRDWIIYWV